VNADPGRLEVVILLQPPPYLSGLDTYDGVFARGVVGGSPEHLGTNDTLLEEVGAAGQTVLNHVREELFTAL